MPLYHLDTETFSQLIEAVAIQKMPLQASLRPVTDTSLDTLLVQNCTMGNVLYVYSMDIQ